MQLSEAIVIALIAQIPFVIKEIIAYIRRDKIERNKLKADEQSALGNAVEGAGKTLVDAWKHIEELECWKKEAIKEIAQLKDALEIWMDYAGRLEKQLKKVAPNARPVPFDPCGKLRQDINAKP